MDFSFQLNNINKIIYLAILQGITEFLPISSSGHLAIAKHFLKFETQSLSIDIFLHFGSLLAIFLFFFKEIKKIFLTDNRNILLYIFIGIIPAGIIGLLFKNYIESNLLELKYIGFFYLFSAFILLATFFKKRKNEYSSLNYYNSLIIGLIQIFALLPGISRSGSTIATGLLLNIEPIVAGKFSFFMAIPLIFGAVLKDILDFNFTSINFVEILIGIFISFIVSYLTLKILFLILKKNRFGFFGFYCLILSLTILCYCYYNYFLILN